METLEKKSYTSKQTIQKPLSVILSSFSIIIFTVSCMSSKVRLIWYDVPLSSAGVRTLVQCFISGFGAGLSLAGFGLIGGSLGLSFSIGRAFGFGNTTWTGLGRQVFFRLLAI